MTNQPSPKRRYGCIVAAMAAVGIAIALALPAVRAWRKAELRRTRYLSLTSIGPGLQYFNEVYKHLPPAVHTDKTGRPLSSWRLRMVAFVEGIMRSVDYDRRWDDPANDWLTGNRFGVYCLPSMRDDLEAVHTNVVAITGPGTAFDGDRECRLEDLSPNTILAVEIVDSGIPWAAPGDLAIDEISESILKGFDGDGVHVIYADGYVRFIPGDVPLDEFKKFCTIEGAKKAGPEKFLGQRTKRR